VTASSPAPVFSPVSISGHLHLLQETSEGDARKRRRRFAKGTLAEGGRRRRRRRVREEL